MSRRLLSDEGDDDNAQLPEAFSDTSPAPLLLLLEPGEAGSDARNELYRVFGGDAGEHRLHGLFRGLNVDGEGQVSSASFDAAMRRFQHECNVPAIQQTPAVAFTQHTTQLFAALDRDGDGDISWSDLTAALAPAQRRWKLWTFGCIFVGYFCYYLNRGSFTFVAPFLRTDLGWSLQEVGRISSLFPLLYGCSKFASGVAVDVLGSRAVFAAGLVLSGLVNLACGSTTSFVVMSGLWAANGFFQGFGGPACAKLLTQWIPIKERGFWWAVWTASQNLGGAVIPLLAGGAAAAYGWRYGMLIPGATGLVAGVGLLMAVRNSPQEMGLPPADLANPSESGGGTKTAGAAERESTRDIVVKYVLRNKAIWALAFSYFFLYIVRQGMTSWGQFYIVDQKGVSSAAQAAATMSGLEIGGLFGGLCSGVLSDACNGFRMRVVVLYMVGLAVALAGLALAPSGDTRHLIAWLSAIGFFIYGPQMLIGLIGSEVSHPRAVGTGNGLLGWIAYIGAACAGEPVAHVVKSLGWGAWFWLMLGSCVVPVVLLVPFWSVRKYEDFAQPA